MTLRRTASGLASLHLFFRVDCVVYCEGGEQLSETQIFAGHGDEDTLDAYFWRSIADYLQASRTYHFKSVGNKAMLKTIAHDVDRIGIHSVIVCMDRDYEWHCGRAIDNSHIVYSYGYSWENDVCCALGFERLYFRLFPRTAAAQAEVQRALRHFDRFASDLVKWCEIEITLFSRNLDLVFVRNKPMASLDVSGQFPKLNITRVQAQLRRVGFSRRPKRHVAIPRNEVMRHVWGKLSSRYLYHLFIKLIAQHGTTAKMNYDLFMRFMISEMLETLRTGLSIDKRNYYHTLSGTFA